MARQLLAKSLRTQQNARMIVSVTSALLLLVTACHGSPYTRDIPSSETPSENTTKLVRIELNDTDKGVSRFDQNDNNPRDVYSYFQSLLFSQGNTSASLIPDDQQPHKMVTGETNLQPGSTLIRKRTDPVKDDRSRTSSQVFMEMSSDMREMLPTKSFSRNPLSTEVALIRRPRITVNDGEDENYADKTSEKWNDRQLTTRETNGRDKGETQGSEPSLSPIGQHRRSTFDDGVDDDESDKIQGINHLRKKREALDNNEEELAQTKKSDSLNDDENGEDQTRKRRQANRNDAAGEDDADVVRERRQSSDDDRGGDDAVTRHRRQSDDDDDDDDDDVMRKKRDDDDDDDDDDDAMRRRRQSDDDDDDDDDDVMRKRRYSDDDDDDDDDANRKRRHSKASAPASDEDEDSDYRKRRHSTSEDEDDEEEYLQKKQSHKEEEYRRKKRNTLNTTEDSHTSDRQKRRSNSDNKFNEEDLGDEEDNDGMDLLALRRRRETDGVVQQNNTAASNSVVLAHRVKRIRQAANSNSGEGTKVDEDDSGNDNSENDNTLKLAARRQKRLPNSDLPARDGSADAAHEKQPEGKTETTEDGTTGLDPGDGSLKSVITKMVDDMLKTSLNRHKRSSNPIITTSTELPRTKRDYSLRDVIKELDNENNEDTDDDISDFVVPRRTRNVYPAQPDDVSHARFRRDAILDIIQKPLKDQETQDEITNILNDITLGPSFHPILTFSEDEVKRRRRKRQAEPLLHTDNKDANLRMRRDFRSTKSDDIPTDSNETGGYNIRINHLTSVPDFGTGPFIDASSFTDDRKPMQTGVQGDNALKPLNANFTTSHDLKKEKPGESLSHSSRSNGSTSMPVKRNVQKASGVQNVEWPTTHSLLKQRKKRNVQESSQDSWNSLASFDQRLLANQLSRASRETDDHKPFMALRSNSGYVQAPNRNERETNKDISVTAVQNDKSHSQISNRNERETNEDGDPFMILQNRIRKPQAPYRNKRETTEDVPFTPLQGAWHESDKRSTQPANPGAIHDVVKVFKDADKTLDDILSNVLTEVPDPVPTSEIKGETGAENHAAKEEKELEIVAQVLKNHHANPLQHKNRKRDHSRRDMKGVDKMQAENDKDSNLQNVKSYAKENIKAMLEIDPSDDGLQPIESDFENELKGVPMSGQNSQTLNPANGGKIRENSKATVVSRVSFDPEVNGGKGSTFVNVDRPEAEVIATDTTGVGKIASMQATGQNDLERIRKTRGIQHEAIQDLFKDDVESQQRKYGAAEDNSYDDERSKRSNNQMRNFRIDDDDDDDDDDDKRKRRTIYRSKHFKEDVDSEAEAEAEDEDYRKKRNAEEMSAFPYGTSGDEMYTPSMYPKDDNDERRQRNADTSKFDETFDDAQDNGFNSKRKREVNVAPPVSTVKTAEVIARNANGATMTRLAAKVNGGDTNADSTGKALKSVKGPDFGLGERINEEEEVRGPVIAEDDDDGPNSGYSFWGEWSACSTTCGEEGRRQRARTCEDHSRCTSGNLEEAACIPQQPCSV